MILNFVKFLFGVVCWMFNQLYDVFPRIYWELQEFSKRRREGALTTTFIAGQYLYNRPFSKLFWRTLAHPTLSRVLWSCAYNLDRIRVMNSHFLTDEFQDMLIAVFNELKKSDELARRMMDKARRFIRKSNFDSALRCYNLAMSFARNNGRQIGRIHIERFNLLVKMNQSPVHFASIEMIDPRNHSVANFGTITYLQKIMSSVSDVQNEEKRRIFCDKILFTIHGDKNNRIQSAADYVKIVRNKDKGRHVIVTKSVIPGTTVIVEDPYVSVLNDSTLWETKHCAKCFREILWGIPCRTCVFAVYCSELCLSEDYNAGHKYECGCMPYVHAARMPPNLRLALKAISKAGPSILYNLYLESKKQNGRRRSRRLLKGFDPKTGKYDSDSYYQVLHLASHLVEEDMFSLTWISIAITKVLETKTTFFEDVPKIEMPEFVEFVINAFFQHSISFQYNSFSLSENDLCELMTKDSNFHDVEGRLDKIERKQIVSAVYSLLPIMNHSCYPTAFRENLPDGKTAIITTRSLSPGDELTICYGYDFMTYPLAERQTRLFKNYRFQCHCVPCTYKWPILKDLRTDCKELCPDCSLKFRHFQIIELRKCILYSESKDGVLICDNCEQKFDSERIYEQAAYVEMMLVRADQLVMEGKPIPAIPILAACVTFFQYKIASPAPQLFLAQQLLLRAFELVVHSK